MFKKYRSQNRIQASINMTPMIDVVFLLLSFFMVTSTYIQTSSLNVDLPKAKTSDSTGQQDNVITILKDGSLQWNGKVLVISELPQTLKNLKSNSPNATLVIQGDEGVPYGSLVEVMDQARIAGIEKLSLATVIKK